VSNDSFITLTSGNSGSGNGTVNYSVAANPGAARTGTMTIAGHTFTVTQDGPPSGGKCPRTQGFWKTHPNEWPVTSLTLGGQTYTQRELLALLNLPTRNDASIILAHQLIAAKLNIANGSDPTPISATITDADSLLSRFAGKLPYRVSPSSPIGQAMVNDAEVLDRYNNGQMTPNCTP
jgi:hypothetical protein